MTSPVASLAADNVQCAHSRTGGLAASRASSRPCSAASTASRSRPSAISVAAVSIISCTQDVLAPGLGRDLRAALEVGQRGIEAARAIRRARPSIQNAGSRVASCAGLSRSSAAAASSTAPEASCDPASTARASAPHASAAASKTGSPIALASSRASLAWPWASARSQPISAVRASASRSRMRSGDGCAGSAPSATCSRRRASAVRPSHHSAFAMPDGEAQAVGRLGRAQRGEQRVARAGRVPRRRLGVGEPQLDRRAARPGSGAGREHGGEHVAPRCRARATGARRPPRRARAIASSSSGTGGLLDVMRPLHRRRRRDARAPRPPERARRSASRPAPPRRSRAARPDGGTRSAAARRPAGRAPGRAARRARPAPRPRRARRPAAASPASNGSPATAAPSSSRRAPAGQRAELRGERGGHGGRRPTPSPAAAAVAPRPARQLLEVERVASAVRVDGGRGVAHERPRLAASSGPGARRTGRRRRAPASAPPAAGRSVRRARAGPAPRAAGAASAASASSDPGSAQCTSSRQSDERRVGREPLEAHRAARDGAGGDRPGPRRAPRPSASSHSAYGRSASYSDARAASTVQPPACAARCASSRDLPMPGSPSITSTAPAPPRSAASAPAIASRSQLAPDQRACGLVHAAIVPRGSG